MEERSHVDQEAAEEEQEAHRQHGCRNAADEVHGQQDPRQAQGPVERRLPCPRLDQTAQRRTGCRGCCPDAQVRVGPRPAQRQADQVEPRAQAPAHHHQQPSGRASFALAPGCHRSGDRVDPRSAADRFGSPAVARVRRRIAERDQLATELAHPTD